jgi:uncharacterized protein YbcI
MSNPTAASELEIRIADQIALLQADYYGVPPRGARAYVIPGEIVVVVLRETFTPAEKVLIRHGDADAIQHSRRRFQQLSRENFAAVVEQATGEQVDSFLSETHLENEVAVEIFLLAGRDRTRMDAFEMAKLTSGHPREPSTKSDVNPQKRTEGKETI